MRNVVLAFVTLAVGVGAARSEGAEFKVGCQVAGVGVYSQRVYVRCDQPYTGTSIVYFAVPASNRDLATRAQADGLVAQVTGTPVDIEFSLADLSGSGIGCSNVDCRLMSGLEIRGVGPLVARTAPGREAGALAAIVAPEPHASLEALAAGAVLVALVLRRRLSALRARSL
jgi:hypothetical protein